MCCFSDLSQTCFRGSRGIKIKIKGKTGKQLDENAKVLETMSILKKLFFRTFSLNDQCTVGSEKRQINWVWHNGNNCPNRTYNRYIILYVELIVMFLFNFTDSTNYFFKQLASYKIISSSYILNYANSLQIWLVSHQNCMSLTIQMNIMGFYHCVWYQISLR